MRKRARPSGLDDPFLKTLLGSTFLSRITENAPDKAPLRVGAQVWSTHDLAVQLGVVHTKAARLITAAADSIGAKNVRDLYARSSPYTFAGIRGLGETAMYVLWRLFESQGLDVDAWAAGDSKEALVSFHSLKAREQKAEARTQRDARAARRRARRQAHEASVSTVLQ